MKRSTYLVELDKLKKLLEAAADTPFTMFAKALTLVTMNMRYEKVAFGPPLAKHPYVRTRDIIRDAAGQFRALADISFIESDDRSVTGRKSRQREEKHYELFNEMWNKYDSKGFRRYIDRYIRRIRVNNLSEFIRGKACVDLGCGNGNFCFALLECGAESVAGIDIGEKSIAFAQRYARESGFGSRARFKVASVYATGFKNDAFDFAVQNGVFHHLDFPDKAVRETARILKPGGWFWYYTTGKGSIARDLWDASVHLLRNVPAPFIENILNIMNVSRNKTVHLTDGLSATYSPTSWADITKSLGRRGFGNFRRLKGGFSTDFDLDRIESDPYGREKFGEGDLRILCQLTGKQLHGCRDN